MKERNLCREYEAVEVYQHALKRVARVLQRACDGMLKVGCYWRVRSECENLIVSVKQSRVGALCELSKLRQEAASCSPKRKVRVAV